MSADRSSFVGGIGSRLRALLRQLPAALYIEGKEYSTDYHLVHLANMPWRGVTLRISRWMVVLSPGWSSIYRVRQVVPTEWKGLETRLDPRQVEILRRSPKTECLCPEFVAALRLDYANRVAVITKLRANYFHSLVQFLPVLLYHEQSFDRVEVRERLLESNPRFVEILNVFGFKVDTLEPVQAGATPCEERFLGNCEDSAYSRANALEVNLLREFSQGAIRDSASSLTGALEKTPLKTSAAIERFQRREGILFIHRGAGAAGRFVKNADEAYARIIAMNGIVVDLEKLSTLEQISLFSHAEIVAGLHGAGFANIVFAQPGAVVFELHSDAEIKSTYATMARSLGLKYRTALLPTGTRAPSGRPGAVAVTPRVLDELEVLASKAETNR
jgi:hypothetical protein